MPGQQVWEVRASERRNELGPLQAREEQGSLRSGTESPSRRDEAAARRGVGALTLLEEADEPSPRGRGAQTAAGWQPLRGEAAARPWMGEWPQPPWKGCLSSLPARRASLLSKRGEASPLPGRGESPRAGEMLRLLRLLLRRGEGLPPWRGEAWPSWGNEMPSLAAAAAAVPGSERRRQPDRPRRSSSCGSTSGRYRDAGADNNSPGGAFSGAEQRRSQEHAPGLVNVLARGLQKRRSKTAVFFADVAW